MDFEQLTDCLEELRTLRQKIRQRSMLYQVDWKERQAIGEGKALDTYHHMPYVQWDHIRDSRYN